jgi:AcrR family transcriptional regulator
MAGVAAERWTPERRRRLTRDALVDAAAEVFAERGFEGASLDEIAETAGYTRGAIYKHFDGKEDLFFAVNDKLNERALAGFAELLGEGNPFEADLAAIAARWQELQVRDARQVSLMLEFNLYAMRNPEVRERVTAQRRDSSKLVEEFVREQSEKTGVRLPLPPEDLARIFLIASDGFSMAAPLSPDSMRLYEPFLRLLVTALAQPTRDDGSGTGA